MLRYLQFTVVITLFFIGSTAFSNHFKKSISGEGIASGNIPFTINATATHGLSQIRYGNVTAPVQSVAIAANGKMATVYFNYHEAILGITVIDGKKGNPDQISDPFPADVQQLNMVVPRFSYNEVTSGAIHLR